MVSLTRRYQYKLFNVSPFSIKMIHGDHIISIYIMFYLEQDFEIENQKLRETLDEYHEEFAEVKNQGIYYSKFQAVQCFF